MPPTVFADLIIRIGFPAALELMRLVQGGNQPMTAEQATSLATLAGHTSQSLLEGVRNRG